MRKLYAVEKKIRAGNYSSEEIYEIRQEEFKPILDDFEKWLKKKKLQTRPRAYWVKPWPMP